MKHRTFSLGLVALIWTLSSGCDYSATAEPQEFENAAPNGTENAPAKRRLTGIKIASGRAHGTGERLPRRGGIRIGLCKSIGVSLPWPGR